MTNHMSPHQPGAASRPLTYKAVIRPRLFLVGLLFFIALSVHSWNETQGLLQQLNWPVFILSALLAVVDGVLISLLFQRLLTKYGFQIDYPRVGQMYFYGQMAKYIPGRFWSIIYHATFLQRPGVISAMLFANLDITALMILRNLAIAFALVTFTIQPWLAGFIFVVGTSAFLLLGHSCWIAQFFRLLIHRFPSLIRNMSPCHPAPIGRSLLLISLGTWAAFLAANFLVLQVAFGLPLHQAALYIAYFGLAWVVGVISFIVPAGIGVREFTFVFLAQALAQDQSMTIELLSAIAVMYRFWQVLHEIGALGIGFILSRLKKPLPAE